MKIYAGVIAYNEQWIIEPSLKSIYDYVDEIIVIDGSPYGASKDRTADIARSVGDKVKVISGTFCNEEGTDHKWIQRIEYLKQMDRNTSGNWCILHDADEVWDKNNIGRLTDYLRTANPKTMLFSYQWVHLFGDCWHYIHSGVWDAPRNVGAFRLVPGVTHLNHHTVGIREQVNFQNLKSPGRIILDDVMFYHYGHACGFDKAAFKARYYFMRDKKCRAGYDIEQWQIYFEKVFVPNWKKRMSQPNVLPYEGEHPEVMQPLLWSNK